MLGNRRADHVILVRQYRHAYGARAWSFRAGPSTPVDTDILAAAEREMREETGYTFADAERVVTLNADPARYAPTACISSARA